MGLEGLGLEVMSPGNCTVTAKEVRNSALKVPTFVAH